MVMYINCMYLYIYNILIINKIFLCYRENKKIDFSWFKD